MKSSTFKADRTSSRRSLCRSKNHRDGSKSPADTRHLDELHLGDAVSKTARGNEHPHKQYETVEALLACSNGLLTASQLSSTGGHDIE